MNCNYCGRVTKKSATFCNNTCETSYNKMFAIKSKPTFRTYQEAGKYFNRDFRTIKRFENILFKIDKTLPSANTKWKECKICGELSPSATTRAGYCKSCSAKGLGKKQQGKQISIRYKGENNPNYLHGLSKTTEYNSNSWYVLKSQLNYNSCALTNLKENIDYHHIIPRWFCKLADIDVFDPTNIIGLNHEYHKAVHHLQLDVLLLPILYPLYKKDARQLHAHFVHLLQLHKVHEFPLNQLQSLNLFQVARYPGKQKLIDLLPEFLPPFLNPVEL